MNCPKKVVVKYHYPKCDKECNSDYHAVELFFDKTVMLSLSDEYHDSSRSVISGFLQACKLFWPEFPEIKETRKNDSEW